MLPCFKWKQLQSSYVALGSLNEQIPVRVRFHQLEQIHYSRMESYVHEVTSTYLGEQTDLVASHKLRVQPHSSRKNFCTHLESTHLEPGHWTQCKGKGRIERSRSPKRSLSAKKMSQLS